MWIALVSGAIREVLTGGGAALRLQMVGRHWRVSNFTHPRHLTIVYGRPIVLTQRPLLGICMDVSGNRSVQMDTSRTASYRRRTDPIAAFERLAEEVDLPIGRGRPIPGVVSTGSSMPTLRPSPGFPHFSVQLLPTGVACTVRSRPAGLHAGTTSPTTSGDGSHPRPRRRVRGRGLLSGAAATGGALMALRRLPDPHDEQ